jgi:lipopolysaccharide exporter
MTVHSASGQAAARGVIFTGSALALNILSQLTILAVLARQLPPEEVGVVVLLIILSGFAELLVDAGISNAYIQAPRVSRSATQSLYWTNVVSGFVACILIAISSDTIVAFFEVEGSKFDFYLLSLAFLIIPHGSQSRAHLERALNFQRTAAADAVYSAALVAGVVLLSFTLHDARAYAAGYLLAVACRTTTLLVAGRRLFKPRWHYSFRETRPYLAFGAYQTLDSLLNYASANMAALAVGRLTSPLTLAGYNMTQNYAVNLPGRLNPVLTRVYFPVLSRFQNDLGRLGAGYLKLTFAAGLINAPILSILFVNAESVTQLLLGQEWLWTSDLLRALVVVGLLRALVNPMGAVLSSLARVRIGFAINVAKVVTGIPVLIGMTAAFGYMGAAAASIVLHVLGVLVNCALGKQLMGLPFSRLATAHSLPLLYALVVGAAGWVGAEAMRGESPSLTVAVSAVCGVAVFLAAFSLDRSSYARSMRGAVASAFSLRSSHAP